MPPSDDSRAGDLATGPDETGRAIAIAAEALYLANLLLLPGLAFLALLWLWFRTKDGASPLARCHLMQTVRVSVWGGVLLVLANLAILVLGGWGQAWTWVAVILYFTTIHSTLVLLGMFGLAKAMAGRKWVYPVIGPLCDD
ncbi:MAG: hypothetical protein PHU46_10160 [Rhodocyclaceae bacterium]|nr:hypothetical protein [Rhodocyclaceae bacterium]